MSKRTRSRRSVARQRRRTQLLILGAVVGVAMIVGIILLAAQPTPAVQGEMDPILGDDHVAEGELPDRVGVEPPTSGTHYGTPADAGFYNSPVPDGNLIHSLEHGYVIIWYNCDPLSESECNDMKDGIADIVERDFSSNKVIGMPRDGMETTIALTTWGRISRLDSFDEDHIKGFIRANRGVAPEPNAP